MRRASFSVRLVLLHALIFLALLAGCADTSPAPFALDHERGAQYREQAVEHWRELAREVARQVYDSYDYRNDLLVHPVYVVQPNNRPFSVAFYHLLRTELVSLGLQVAHYPEENSVTLEYTVQTVAFHPSRFDDQDIPFYYSGYSTGSVREVIVNSRLHFNNRFVMQTSAVRYINDHDWQLYADPNFYDPMSESNRTVKVSGNK